MVPAVIFTEYSWSSPTHHELVWTIVNVSGLAQEQKLRCLDRRVAQFSRLWQAIQTYWYYDHSMDLVAGQHLAYRSIYYRISREQATV